MSETKTPRRKVRAQARRVADLVQQAVDDGATSVEEIHKKIANLPLDILERLDVFEDTVKGARKVQDTTIGAFYDVVRKVNREVAKLAKEVLAGRGMQAARRAAPAKRRATARAA